MKHLKVLALAAVAAGALMAFIGGGTASATVICSTTTTPCTSLWPHTTGSFSLSPGTSANLKNLETGETIDTCTGSNVKGTMENGSSTATVIVHVEKSEDLTWTGCTFPTKTINPGTLTIHHITGTSNGTVTGDKFQVTINTVFFGSCIYGTGEDLHLGTITEGKPAIFHAEAKVNFISGGIACPRKSEWNATYVLTQPENTTLSVEPS